MFDLLIDALPLVICAGSLGYMAGHVLCDRQAQGRASWLEVGCGDRRGPESALEGPSRPFDDERGHPFLLRQEGAEPASGVEPPQPRR